MTMKLMDYFVKNRKENTLYGNAVLETTITDTIKGAKKRIEI